MFGRPKALLPHWAYRGGKLRDFATGCRSAQNFVIADLHFGDVRTCRSRPFHDPQDMAKVISRSWNETVRPDDTVYVLGDIGKRSEYDTIALLNGAKHLIAGNTDDLCAIASTGLFASISIARCLPGFLLTHIPVHPTQLRGKAINVHGHLHSANVGDTRYRCVSVEQTGYAPALLAQMCAQPA